MSLGEEFMKEDQKLNNVWLLSFADSRLIKPKKRLLRPALEFGFRKDHVLILDEGDLSDSFREKMKVHLVLGSRGYGYWCWKPEICINTLLKIPDGNILFYIDIGCHLNKKGKSRFYDYIGICNRHGALATQARSLLSSSLIDSEFIDSRHHVYLTSAFTKGDMLDYFNVRDKKEIVNAGQVNSGVLFFRKGEAALNFLKEWRELYYSNFHLLDDTPSVSDNCPNFTANRHDQASLSIMWLLRRWPTISACEIEPLRKYGPACKEFKDNPLWGSNWFYKMSWYPIHAKRDKGTVSYWEKLYRFLRYRIIRKISEKFF